MSVGQNSGWAQLGGRDSESLTRPQRGVIGAAGLEARTGLPRAMAPGLPDQAGQERERAGWTKRLLIP